MGARGGLDQGRDLRRVARIGVMVAARAPVAAISWTRAAMVSASPKPFSMTSQPGSASAFALTKPIPPKEPVTSADLPCDMRFLLLVAGECRPAWHGCQSVLAGRRFV
jgi:hypothetical protein